MSLKTKLEYDVSIAIINVINKEITRRYNEETSTEKKNKPKARGRKK